MKVMEQRLKSEEENYMLIENKYNEIRQLKHDINNQISVANPCLVMEIQKKQ